jgi:NADPH-dependent curcumin reductase CurA
MTPQLNHRVILASRPVGTPEPQHFRLEDAPVPDLEPDSFLVRNHYLSIDPAQRGWVNADSNYSQPVALGDVMRSLAVGRVVQSSHPDYAEGEYLYGWFGWQDFCVAGPSQVLRRVDPDQAPLTAALGVLGINGLTAWLGLEEIGHPKSGETVLVSTAAGGVGSIVGQIARRKGCRVVGLTGNDGKIKTCMDEFGYHSAINYRATRDLPAALWEQCPDGIDVFFDNTSGEISDAVFPLLNIRARIVQCGTAAVALWDPPPPAPRREREILTKRLRHEGFIIFDHISRFPEVAGHLAEWIRKKELIYHEDIDDGLDKAPAALAGLYQGINTGKKIIRLSFETD